MRKFQFKSILFFKGLPSQFNHCRVNKHNLKNQRELSLKWRDKKFEFLTQIEEFFWKVEVRERAKVKQVFDSVPVEKMWTDIEP